VALSNLLFLSSFVARPTPLRHRNVQLLSLLRAAAEQDDQPLAILAEVNSIAWAEIDLTFEDAGPKPL